MGIMIKEYFNRNYGRLAPFYMWALGIIITTCVFIVAESLR
jgi:hypothetical protein